MRLGVCDGLWLCKCDRVAIALRVTVFDTLLRVRVPDLELVCDRLGVWLALRERVGDVVETCEAAVLLGLELAPTATSGGADGETLCNEPNEDEAVYEGESEENKLGLNVLPTALLLKLAVPVPRGLREGLRLGLAVLEREMLGDSEVVLLDVAVDEQLDVAVLDVLELNVVEVVTVELLVPLGLEVALGEGEEVEVLEALGVSVWLLLRVPETLLLDVPVRVALGVTVQLGLIVEADVPVLLELELVEYEELDVAVRLLDGVRLLLELSVAVPVRLHEGVPLGLLVAVALIV